MSEGEGPAKGIDTVCAGNPDCSPEPSKEPVAIAAEQVLQKLRKRVDS